MKAALVLLAICLGVALADPICLPNQFQWQREQQFTSTNNGGYGGFDLGEEWYDYTNKNFRNRVIVWEGQEQIMIDTIIIGSTQKMYTINATKGTGQVTCTVKKAGFPPSTPCLFSNATLVTGVYIAGDVYSNVWAEQQKFGNNNTLYQDITLTADDNIPISSREFYTEYGASFELYFNFAINLDPGAFNPPPLCPDQATEEGMVTPEEISKKFKYLSFTAPDPRK